MGIFASSDPEEQADNIVFPERILSEKIELMAEELNEKIGQINEYNDVDLPQIDSIPSYKQAEGIDAKIAEKYDSVSLNRTENRANRRRLINARQMAQELLELYDTFYTMTESQEGDDQ